MSDYWIGFLVGCAAGGLVLGFVGLCIGVRLGYVDGVGDAPFVGDDG